MTAMHDARFLVLNREELWEFLTDFGMSPFNPDKTALWLADHDLAEEMLWDED